MAKKPLRGLPKGFELEVDDAAMAPAEDLGDFLDENLAGPRPPSTPKIQAPRGKIETSDPDTSENLKDSPEPPRREAQPLTTLSKSEVPVVEKPIQVSNPTHQRQPLRGAPGRRHARFQVSLDADTEQMLQELVAEVKQKTPERGATPSEIIRAAIQAAHEARRYASYSHVNRRGQFGSATARAFVTDLKEAIIAALAGLHADKYGK